MDILFQIHYEWNKELFCLYYQTQNRKYRRILLFFCGAVIIFSFCLCSKIGREMIMTMMILFVCAVILINNIYLRLATYIQMETALKQYGTGKRIMTIKKDEINVLVPESGKKIIVSFIEIMEIGTICRLPSETAIRAIFAGQLRTYSPVSRYYSTVFLT